MAEMMMQQRQKQIQMDMFNSQMMNRMLDDLDPVKYFSRKNIELQSTEYDKLEEKLAQIAGREEGGVFDPKDVLETKFLMDEYEMWQNKLLAGQQQMMMDAKLFEEGTKKGGLYRPENWIAAIENYHEFGEWDSKEALKLNPINGKDWVQKLPLPEKSIGEDQVVYRFDDEAGRHFIDTTKVYRTHEDAKKVYFQNFTPNPDVPLDPNNARYAWMEEGVASFEQDDAEKFEADYQEQIHNPEPNADGTSVPPIYDRNMYWGTKWVLPHIETEVTETELDTIRNQIMGEERRAKTEITKQKTIRDQKVDEKVDEKEEPKVVYGVEAVLVEDYKGTTMMSNVGSKHVSDGMSEHKSIYEAEIDVDTAYHFKLVPKKEDYSFTIPSNWVVVSAEDKDMQSFVGESVEKAGLTKASAKLTDAWQLAGISVVTEGEPIKLDELKDAAGNEITPEEIRDAIGMKEKDYHRKKMGYLLYPGMAIPKGVVALAEKYPSLTERIKNGSELFELTAEVSGKDMIFYAPPSSTITQDLLGSYFNQLGPAGTGPGPADPVPAFKPGAADSMFD